jgi:DNA-binding transcriptional MerR regulator
MGSESLKVGELARRTGLTVRTLHHYDEIGLLRPSLHNEAGYRLYTGHDIARLQQVISLRQLGFSLDEVRECLDRPGFSPLEVIGLHLARLREQIAMQEALCDRLEAVAGRLRTVGEVSTEEFLRTIQEMTMLDTYFTPEQQKRMQVARAALGEEDLQQKQAEWAELIAQVRTEMDRGTDPSDPKVQALARRWQELVSFTTGGDPTMAQAIKRRWDEQGDNIVAQHGSQYDWRPVASYIQKAMAAPQD